MDMNLPKDGKPSRLLLTLNYEGWPFFRWESLVFYRYFSINTISFLPPLKILTAVRMKSVGEGPFDIWKG